MNFKKYFINEDLQTQTDYPFEILGEYRHVYTIYKIELNNFFSTWHYRDMGGIWDNWSSGTYKIIDGIKLHITHKKKYRNDEFFYINSDINGLRLAKEEEEDAYSFFSKLDFPKIVVCSNSTKYPNALAQSHKYYAIEEKLNLYRIIGENQKIRWYPKEYFKELEI